MPRNRVEQLESTVAELESTVEGLTEELVETKERVRVLEAELDADVPTRVPERRGGSTEESLGESPEADPDEVAAAAVDAEEEEKAEGSGADDIIVA